MNAPFAHDTGNSLLSLARKILAEPGKWPKTDHPLFDQADWAAAALDAVHGDHSDLAGMLRKEAAFEAFNEWQRAGARGLSERQFNPREDADFEVWLEGEGRWARDLVPLSRLYVMGLIPVDGFE